MGQRMFVAIVPPEAVIDDLSDFLDARPGMRWVSPQQWHLTLAFFANVPEHRIDELAERLTTKAAKRSVFRLALAGAGAFPDPARASVLWLGVSDSDSDSVEELQSLARAARAAGAAIGAPPDGRRFTPHLTMARLRPPLEATRWLRVLDTYRSPSWEVADVELVASHRGEGPGGRPRYETVAALPLRQQVSS
ncbi:MAG: RNA 2',3'-cyclic phosphodiesterase [Candidatus Phosphoribacter sp.]